MAAGFTEASRHLCGGALRRLAAVVLGAVLVCSFSAPLLAAPTAAMDAAYQAISEGRQAAAIRMLRDQLEQHPDDLEARALLAQLLSWSGALVEAGDQAERVLARDPVHPEALRARADAAAWRGDFATALPVYRRYLRHHPSAQARLAYGNALVAAGYLQRARTTLDEFDLQRSWKTFEEFERVTAERQALVRRLHRRSAPSLLVGGTRYRDSAGSRRNESRAAFEQPLGDVRLNLLLELVETNDDQKSSDAHSALLGAEARVTDWLTASAALGATEIRDDQIDGYPVGRLNAWGRFDNLDYRLRLERNVFDETPTLLTNRIRLSELELGSGYAFSDRLQLAGNLTRTRYSDDNDSTEVELTPQVVLRLRDPGVRLGYRRNHLTFDRQSGSGYFDPDRLEADRIMLFATLFLPRLRGGVELYAGQQRFSRFGESVEQFIAGGSARVEVDLGRHLVLQTEVEGGNFDLRTPEGFSYWMGTLNLVFRL